MVRLLKLAWPSWREAESSLSCMRWNHDARADLMNAFGNLNAIGIGKEIAAVPHVRGVVGAGGRDTAAAGSGDAAADGDAPGLGAGYEGKDAGKLLKGNES